MATIEEKPASTQTLEEKPRSGTLKGEMGLGAFGVARFGTKTGYETTKEAKTAETSTKEAKP